MIKKDDLKTPVKQKSRLRLSKHAAVYRNAVSKGGIFLHARRDFGHQGEWGC